MGHHLLLSQAPPEGAGQELEQLVLESTLKSVVTSGGLTRFFHVTGNRIWL